MLLAACQSLPYEGTATQSDQPTSPWGAVIINGIPVSP
jgi:hypothetical protein